MTAEVKTIENPENFQIEKWKLVNDTSLILGEDTLLYLRDTIFIHYTYLSKDNDLSEFKTSKKDFSGNEFQWRSKDDSTVVTSVFYINDSIYFEKGSFMPDTLPRNWDLVYFEGNSYIKILHSLKGVDAYLKIEDRTDSSFHLKYYDFSSSRFYESELIKNK